MKIDHLFVALCLTGSGHGTMGQMGLRDAQFQGVQAASEQFGTMAVAQQMPSPVVEQGIAGGTQATWPLQQVEQGFQTGNQATAAFTATGTEQVGYIPPVCGPRIRKSWDSLTLYEKNVYLRAIERTMDNGLYAKFVEIHTELMTTSEAHRTCMFVYWHRVLLLGFENLLRSYGGEYSCITVPYWNYVDDSERYLMGRCNSLQDCSMILRDLGGASTGTTRTVVVNGTPVRARCVSEPPVNHYCEASHLSGAACAQCVPRGEWMQETFPPTTSVGSLMRQLFSSATIEDVANNLEQGIHNTIHNSLGGVMGRLEAPADPIFFSHHASIDMLHTIFYHCAVGNTVPVSLDQKLMDSRQFVRCPRLVSLPTANAIDANVLFPQSDVMLRSGEQGIYPNSVRDPTNPLAPYFADLPMEYMSYSDVRDLGVYSYNYQLGGSLANMYMTCASESMLLGSGTDGGQTGGAGASAQTATATTGLGGLRRLQANSTTGTSRETAGAPPALLEAVIEQTESVAGGGWYQELLRTAIDVMKQESGAAKTTTMKEASTTFPNPLEHKEMAAAMEEVEKMTCMFYDECRAPVSDWSDSFRQSFHMADSSSSPCHVIVDNIKNGRDRIHVPNWKDEMTRFIQC